MTKLDRQSKSKIQFWFWIVNHNPIHQIGLQSGLSNPSIQSSNNLATCNDEKCTTMFKISTLFSRRKRFELKNLTSWVSELKCLIYVISFLQHFMTFYVGFTSFYVILHRLKSFYFFWRHITFLVILRVPHNFSPQITKPLF